MTYCTKCKTWMKQTAMGLPAPDAYSRSVRFWGDLYECPGCGAAVLAGFGQAEEIKDEDPPTEEMYENILEKIRAASDPLKHLLDDDDDDVVGAPC